MGFGNVSKCVAMGARDQLAGGDNLDAYAESLAPATGLLTGTYRQTVAALEALRQQSLARANDFHREWLQLAQSAGIQPVQLGIDPGAGAKIAAAVGRSVHQSSSAAASMAIEAAMIKWSWQSFSLLLRPLIARTAKTLGAAGTAAIADGPVPVGDAIGAIIVVGGGAWMAWDVKKAVDAQAGLPGDIESVLRQQLADLNGSAGAALDSLVNSLADFYQADT